jgi:hypothetical protein
MEVPRREPGNQTTSLTAHSVSAIPKLTELGVVIDAPVDVQLTDRDIVQPDLVVITKPRFHIVRGAVYPARRSRRVECSAR